MTEPVESPPTQPFAERPLALRLAAVIGWLRAQSEGLTIDWVEDTYGLCADAIEELVADNERMRKLINQPFHVAVFTPQGWALEHSMSCRLAGTMTTCEYDQAMHNFDPDGHELEELSVAANGRWCVTNVIDGRPVLEPEALYSGATS